MPTSAAATGDGMAGSGDGEIVGALSATSDGFVTAAATEGSVAVGGGKDVTGAATGATGTGTGGVGSAATSFLGAVAAVGVVPAGNEPRPANKRYVPAPSTATTAKPINAMGSALRLEATVVGFAASFVGLMLGGVDSCALGDVGAAFGVAFTSIAGAAGTPGRDGDESKSESTSPPGSAEVSCAIGSRLVASGIVAVRVVAVGETDGTNAVLA